MPKPNEWPFEPDEWEFTEADEILLYGEREDDEDYWLGEDDLTTRIR